MTVASATNRVDYSGNGSSTVFAVPFYFLADSHLLVVLKSAAGVDTTQVLGTNYTVSGAGVESGGTVTMNVAPASGTTLTISRNVPITQETDLQPNDRLPAESLEDALDKLTMIDQQINENAIRAIKVPVSDSTTLNTTLQSAAIRANKYLAFNNLGEPFATAVPPPETLASGDEIQYATAGQTVFTLTTLTYTPGINNLVVFVDGVNQYKGLAYQETSSNTVTFTSGLHAGAEVKFTTARTITTGESDAATTTYVPAGTGAVPTNVQAKLRETVSVKDFGAVGDGVTDDTAAIQAALDATVGKTLQFVSGETYKCTTGLTVQGSIQGNGATLNFYGTTAGGTNNSCVYQTAEGSLTGFTIDATNVTSCQAGLWVNTDFAQQATCFYDLTIQNISNTDNTQAAYGAVFVKTSGATHLDSDLDIKVKATNIIATANGVIGDTGGSAVGVHISFNKTGTNSNVVIHDCVIDTVNCGVGDPDEDAEGIIVYQVDKDTLGARGNYEIRGCWLKDCAKRSIKVQAPNTLVTHCTASGASSEEFAANATNVTFNSCSAFSNSTANAFVLNAASGRISDCYALSSNWGVLKVSSTATYSTIENSEFILNATVSSSEDARAVGFIYGTGVSISNCIFRNTTSTGCGLSFDQSTQDTRISNCKISGVKYGTSTYNVAGIIQYDNCTISTAGQGLYKSGSTLTTVEMSNCDINSTLAAFTYYTSAGANQAKLFLKGSKITTGSSGYGVTCAAGSMICGNEFSSTSTTQPGIVGGNDITVNGNIIRGYQYALQYTYSTTAVVLNNISIGAATGIADKTGYTPFAEANNYAR